MNITRQITHNGLTLWARWHKGYKKHVLLMMDRFTKHDKWATSGWATIARTKEGLNQ